MRPSHLPAIVGLVSYPVWVAMLEVSLGSEVVGTVESAGFGIPLALLTGCAAFACRWAALRFRRH